MINLDALNIRIFGDGANINEMLALYADPRIKGFTTNPTLMRKAGIVDYEAFALEVLEKIADRPISFEVFADDFPAMDAQARVIDSWGANVYVKIPVTNTKAEPSYDLIRSLSEQGIKLNVTAIMTDDQVKSVVDALHIDTPAVVSVFAGRIADTGIDPVPLMRNYVEVLKGKPKSELLWASPRELLNVFQADEVGCHIITATPDILKKLSLVNKDLAGYSLETVEMFYDDASAAGYTIGTPGESTATKSV